MKRCDLNIVVPTQQVGLFEGGPVALRSPEGLVALRACWVTIYLGPDSFAECRIGPNCIALIAQDDGDGIRIA